MRPIEPDYEDRCKDPRVREDGEVKALGLEDEECVRLLRRGARRCHAMARRYILGSLNGYVEAASRLAAPSDDVAGSVSSFATTLSLIEVGAYKYLVEFPHRMLVSAARGFAPTWQVTGFNAGSYSASARLQLEGKRIEVRYRSSPYVGCDDLAGRGWDIQFYLDHTIMTYRQYRRWADVYRKWQDKALAAVAARTL
jgi:hypothetical protein